MCYLDSPATHAKGLLSVHSLFSFQLNSYGSVIYLIYSSCSSVQPTHPLAVHSFKCPQDFYFDFIKTQSFIVPLTSDSQSPEKPHAEAWQALRLAICLASSSYGLRIDASQPTRKVCFRFLSYFDSIKIPSDRSVITRILHNQDFHLISNIYSLYFYKE